MNRKNKLSVLDERNDVVFANKLRAIIGNIKINPQAKIRIWKNIKQQIEGETK
jgi:hypothetical protein